MNKMMMTLALFMASTLVAGATDAVQKRIPTIHLDTCAITLLEADGIKPMAGAKLSLSQIEGGEPVVTSVANPAGLCEITVAEGRYVLSVNERPITLLNAAKDGELAWARIVVSETPMLVGGQDAATEEGGSRRVFTFFGLSGGAAVGTALLTGAAVVGGGYAVYDNNNNNNNNDTPPAPVTPSPTDTTAPRRGGTRPPSPVSP